MLIGLILSRKAEIVIKITMITTIIPSRRISTPPAIAAGLIRSFDTSCFAPSTNLPRVVLASFVINFALVLAYLPAMDFSLFAAFFRAFSCSFFVLAPILASFSEFALYRSFSALSFFSFLGFLFLGGLLVLP